MKKHVLCLCVMSALFTSVVNAQMLDNKVRAEVPFGFHAGAVTLAAGEYQIASHLRGVLIVTNLETRRAVLVSGNAALNANARGGKGRLIFKRYGNQYFLRNVWSGGINGIEMTPTPLERELQAQAPAENAVIYAKR